MGYLACTSCGNHEEFFRTNRIRAYQSEVEYIDGEENNVDWGDCDTEDSDIDEYGSPYCSRCDNEADWYDTEEERNEALVENGFEPVPIENGEPESRRSWREEIGD